VKAENLYKDKKRNKLGDDKNGRDKNTRGILG
jgi:hypothetical protein